MYRLWWAPGTAAMAPHATALETIVIRTGSEKGR